MLYRFAAAMLMLLAIFATVVQAEPRDDVRSAIVNLQQHDPGFSWNTIVKDWVGDKIFHRDNITGRLRKDGFGEVDIRPRDQRVYLVSYFNKRGDFVTNLAGNWSLVKNLDAAKAADANQLAAAMTAPQLALSMDQIRATLDGASAVRIDPAKNAKSDGDIYIADLTKDQIATLLANRVPASLEPTAPPPLVKSSEADRGAVRYTIKAGLLTKTEIHLFGAVQSDPNTSVKLHRIVETDFAPIDASKLRFSENAMAALGQ